jgi:hypothetical protein
MCVMTRCIWKHILNEDVDEVFAQCRQRQYEADTTFSALAASVADIALDFCEEDRWCAIPTALG